MISTAYAASAASDAGHAAVSHWPPPDALGAAGHLPVLVVMFPLLAALLCAPFRTGKGPWWIALLVAWASFAMALKLLFVVLETGVSSYALGGWAPPWGIEFRTDLANAFVLVIVTAVAAVGLIFARESVEHEIEDDNLPLFYTCFLLCFGGLLGVASTGDAFNFYVFLEISSLSTYVLVAMGARRDRRALTAAYTYLVMGTIGATMFVIGVGLLYAKTGSLNMADLAERLPGAEDRAVAAGFGFIVVGLALKTALFPLHLWLPNAYAFAPTAVTAFLAATATKVAVYGLLRFVFTVFGVDFADSAVVFTWLFMPLALIGMFAGSTVAIFQVDLKRMLAYSSVAQLGYMILGLSFGTVTGLTASLIHLFNHALMKAGLFMAVGCLIYRLGSASIDSVRGAGRRMPLTMAAFVGGGLSLIGVPLTVGFVSKWYLVLAALESGMWPVALLIVASSLLAVIYVWRIVEAAYLQPPPEADEPVGGVGASGAGEAPLSMLIPAWIFVIACVWFGANADFTAGVAEKAAEALIGGGS